MRSIWQKQSRGLFRSECLISLCSITHFCRWSSRNVLLLFLFFARFELATRGSKCAAFGRNSPGDCFAASALYLCADYLFLPVKQHVFSGVAVLIAVLGNARYKKAGQFSNCPTVFDCFFVKRS